MRRHQFDVAVDAHLETHQMRQAVDERQALADIRFARLHHQHADLARLGSRHRECKSVADPGFLLMLRKILEVLRPDIAAVDDDQVFLASGDDQTAVDRVSNVAGVEPPIRAERGPGFRGALK